MVLSDAQGRLRSICESPFNAVRRYLVKMEMRPVRPADLDDLAEIDGTIESSQYLHLERCGEGLAVGWSLAERALREKRILPNRIDDEKMFALKQIATAADEGVAVLAEHEGAKVALVLAQAEPEHRIMRVHDLRVDFDHRRQGLASVLLFQVITAAREQELRAVRVETLTDNLPAAHLLRRCGFELAGLDTQRHSNHDLVKESATLIWYASLD